MDIESYGGGIRVLAPCLIVWGYVDIYRRKEYIGGATGGPRGWRARLPPGCALLPRGLLVGPPTCTPSLLGFFPSKNEFREVSGQLDSV